VTSFEFRLHKVGPEVLAGLIVHPLDAARDVLRFYRDFIATAPQGVCLLVRAAQGAASSILSPVTTLETLFHE